MKSHEGDYALILKSFVTTNLRSNTIKKIRSYEPGTQGIEIIGVLCDYDNPTIANDMQPNWVNVGKKQYSIIPSQFLHSICKALEMDKYKDISIEFE